MFHRRFPDKVISPTRLSMLYKSNGIRLKVVRRVKNGPPSQKRAMLEKQKEVAD